VNVVFGGIGMRFGTVGTDFSLLHSVPAYTYEISALIKIMYIQTVSVNNLQPVALSKDGKPVGRYSLQISFGDIRHV
jgi:hypothetical protein